MPKLLKNAYARQIKLIYIDPPYNTGDAFTYNDDFSVPERQYLADTGQVDEQGNALSSRVETRGRKHAPWLTMMFSRLVLGRHLLRRDETGTTRSLPPLPRTRQDDYVLLRTHSGEQLILTNSQNRIDSVES